MDQNTNQPQANQGAAVLVGSGTLLRVFLKILNEAYVADPGALLALIDHRVPCNVALADHPTIQVGGSYKGGAEVGLLGIINGICEAATGQRVAMQVNDKTGEIEGFTEYSPNKTGDQFRGQSAP